MKNLFSLLIFTCSAYSFGQTGTIDELLAAAGEERQALYVPASATERTLRLQMAYGSSHIANPAEAQKLQGAKIAAIDVVYSDHPAGKGFPALTRRRIDNLEKLYPGLLSDKEIVWRFIRQTACTDKTSAQKLFHGLVITYRPPQSTETMKAEIAYLEDLLHETAKTSQSKSDSRKFISSKYKVAKESESDEPEEYPVPIYEMTELVLAREISSNEVGNNAVAKILERNNWKKMAIAADLTGSMSPYTGQLLLWFKLNTTDDRVKQFVFFNDGNHTPDRRKVIGSTGGIYAGKASGFEEVKKLAIQTMMAGGGGDGPENNIEALLKTSALCPECENLVMIADNWAPVKDIALLSQVKKPVKIILCGVYGRVNPDYLNIAFSTGGSVHTMEEDLLELAKLHDGEQIEIGGQTYKLVHGKFTWINKK